MPKTFALLISPRAKSAFFNDYLSVCTMELSGLLESLPGGAKKDAAELIDHQRIGEMDFFNIQADEKSLPLLAELSFIYGIFEKNSAGLTPLDIPTNFALHDDFIWGSKFKGKTSETLTQFMLNIGLQQLRKAQQLNDIDRKKIKLLDPMCGRGTSLLWAMRYGINSKGIEQDPKALDDIQRITKKWCKIHRQKHTFTDAFTGKKNKQGNGRYIDFGANGHSLRVFSGDTQDATTLLKGEKFNLIISDLPYGVQHFTTDKTRSCLEVVAEAAAGWAQSLKPGGIMVLAFNRYIPKRDDLLAVFNGLGFEDTGLSAEHRMSESIVRDIIVLKRVIS